MRRALVLLLLIIMSSCLLSSCGGSDNTDNAGENYARESGEEMSFLDFDSVYQLCDDFLKNYYSTVNSSEEKFAVNEYARNDKFIEYVEEKTKNAGGSDTKTSITNGLGSIEWHEKYVFLEIQSVVLDEEGSRGSSVSEINQLLIEPIGNRFYIADWYSHGTVSFDELMCGQQERISDPNIWEDEAFTMQINKQLNKYSK